MFAQLVSKQAEYAISYGNLLGNTVLPSCIAHSAYSTRFIVYMYVKSGFPLYCRFVLPCYNVARAKFKPYYRMRRKPYEYAYLAKYAVFVCIIPYGVFRLIRRSHIPICHRFVIHALARGSSQSLTTQEELKNVNLKPYLRCLISYLCAPRAWWTALRPGDSS